MTALVDVLMQQVLQLPAADRALLLDRVISSLDADSERDALWHALAAERDSAADADPSLLSEGPVALARVRSDLR